MCKKKRRSEGPSLGMIIGGLFILHIMFVPVNIMAITLILGIVAVGVITTVYQAYNG